MYIQITTRCNMLCRHCCYSCRAKGTDMTLETFRNAIKLAGDSLSIGGGEPTIHPLFWQFLGESMAYADIVWLATNGSMTETSLTLAKMARKGIISVALSRDVFHDNIDERVVDAFTKDRSNPYGTDYREIRDVSSHFHKQGRAKKNELCGDLDGCLCADLFVRPNGDIHICGCLRSPKVGNVNGAAGIPDDYEYGECYKKQPSKRRPLCKL